MLKKLTLLAMSVAALVAFAVPASASAVPLVHDEKGEAVESISAVSENTISFTTAGRLECATVVLDVTFTENTTETAHGHGDGRAFGTKPSHSEETPCYNPDLKRHVEITRVAVNTIHLNDDGTGTATFEFDFTIPMLISCTIKGNANLTYEGGSSTLNLAGGLSSTTPGCPEAGTISGSFELQEGVTIG